MSNGYRYNVIIISKINAIHIFFLSLHIFYGYRVVDAHCFQIAHEIIPFDFIVSADSLIFYIIYKLRQFQENLIFSHILSEI